MLADFEKGLETITGGLTAVNAEFDKIQTLLERAEAAGSKALAQLENDYESQMTKVQAAEDKYAAELAKLDRALKTSGYAQLGRDYAVRPDTGYAVRLATEYAVRPAGYDAAKDTTLGDTWSLTKWNKDETWPFTIEARLENETGKPIGTASVSLTNQILAAAYTQPMSDSVDCVFIDVPVDDITDRMKVSIERVNGKDITSPENADYIKVSPLEPDGFTEDGYDIAGYDKQGYNALGYDKNGRNRKGQLGPLQRELDRIAAEEQKARNRQFARERLAGEIWAGGMIVEKKGFAGGANFILRLGGKGNHFFFPLGIMTEASLMTPMNDDGVKIESNVGGGLRLALEDERCSWLSLSASGGVSFIDNDVVPYLHINGFTAVAIITGGVFIRFPPYGVDYAGYLAAKIRIPNQIFKGLKD
jgi:hypothetical protein